MNEEQVVLKKYKLKNVISRRQFSTIYLAEDVEDENRPVVVKEMMVTFPDQAHLAAAGFVFNRESGMLKNLRHNGIVNFIDSGQENARFYLVSEYVEGLTLTELMDSKKPGMMSERESLFIMMQLIEALKYLNSLSAEFKPGREISSDNVMIDKNGIVKIVDLGISRFFCPKETNYREISGFNSPEVISGQEYDEKSDVFALGSLFYYLLTGKKPNVDFPDDTPLADALNNDVSRPVANFISECLAPGIRRIEGVEQFEKELSRIRRRSIESDFSGKIKEQRRIQKIKSFKKYVRKLLFTVFIILVLAPVILLGIEKLALYLCRKNMEKIAAATERYAKDHNGCYPESLDDLIPEYIDKIPKCLRAGFDTYSRTYRCLNEDGFRFCEYYCCGRFHRFAGVSENYPGFNNFDGILTEPVYSGGKIDPLEVLVDAFMLDRNGDYEGAFKKLRSLTVMNQESLRERGGIEKYLIFWNMARILEKMKNKKEALEKYRTAASLFLRQSYQTPNMKAVNTLACDIERVGGTQEAMTFFNRLADDYLAEQAAPDAAVVSDVTDVYESRGMDSTALEYLKKYYNKCPDSEKNFIRAEIERLRGEDEKAADNYRKYLESNPDSPLAEKARERLLQF